MLNAHALAVVLCVKMISSKIKKIFIVDVDKIPIKINTLLFVTYFTKTKGPHTSPCSLTTYNGDVKEAQSNTGCEAGHALALVCCS